MYEQTVIQLLIEFGPAELQGAVIWVPAPGAAHPSRKEVIHNQNFS